MSALTIGRFGTDIQVTNTMSWQEDGSRITVTGQTPAVSVAESLALRQQLLGYVDTPDEIVVPVTYSTDPSVDGFYRVTAASVDADLNNVSLISGIFPFSVSLERIQGFAAPMIESVVRGGLRANASGVTSSASLAWHAIPGTAVGYETGAPTLTESRPVTEDGSVRVFYGGSNTLYNSRPAWFVNPADWYMGAATLRMWDSALPAAPHRAVVGRQIPNDPHGWEISNGLTRVWMPDGPNAMLQVSTYNDGQWSPGHQWTLYRQAGVSEVLLATAHTVTVIRNSPEEVCVRLTCDAASAVVGSWFVTTIDVSLRRGQRLANVVLTARGNYQWGIKHYAFGSDMGGYVDAGWGQYGNQADLAGGHVFIASANALTLQSSGWGNYLTVGGRRLDIGIGTIQATGPNTAQVTAMKYFAAQTEQTTVVAR